MGTSLEGRFEENLQPSFPKSLETQVLDSPRSVPMRIDDMELKEEWQDEEFPRPLPEETPEDSTDSTEDEPVCPPNTLELCGNRHVKRLLSAPTINLNLENSEDSVESSKILDQTPDLDFDIDDLETPNSSELLDFTQNSQEFEWEDDLPKANKSEHKAYTDTLVTDLEDKTGRKWRIFLIGQHKVDMTAIEPYQQVISHGGYYGDGLNAIIVFASCYLPDSSIPNYQYVMDNLFRYVIGTLDLMVAEDYMLIYLNGATPRSKLPTFGWLKQCYQATGRRLKKDLKSVLIVHPTWYVKALLVIIRPFISSKFMKKVKFIDRLKELSQIVSIDDIHIPECIKMFLETSARASQGLTELVDYVVSGYLNPYDRIGSFPSLVNKERRAGLPRGRDKSW